MMALRLDRRRSRHLAACSGGLLAMLAVLSAAELAAQDDVARRRRDYDRQPTAVGKAKKIPNLGDAQFSAARRALRDSKVDDALRYLQDYRDLVYATRNALLGEVPNPEKKHAGYKHMEIHVRKSIDQMTDIIADAPLDKREFFETIRADLETISKLLIRDLFPRQPGRTPAGKQP